MSNYTLTITDALYQYWLHHGVKENSIMQELRIETQKMPNAVMQISPEQAAFMQFLARLTKVKKALEIGVFTGYSALAVALVLPENGKLIACDQSEEWTDIAKRYWKKAKVDHKIELHLQPAVKTLQALSLSEPESFDFIFIDADKITYDAYFTYALQLLKPDGVILIDNVFFAGEVANPDNTLPATRAIRALNQRLLTEPNIHYCILPIGDGLTLVSKV